MDIHENVPTLLSLQLDSIAAILPLHLSLIFMVVLSSCQNARIWVCLGGCHFSRAGLQDPRIILRYCLCVGVHSKLPLALCL